MKKLSLVLLFALLAIPVKSNAQVVQHKACERSPVNGWIMPCTFDKPVRPGDLIVVVGVQGCGATTCDSVSDSQINTWKTAIVVPNFDGIPLWYALDAKGGYDTIYFAYHTGSLAIIAEYPPSSGLDDASAGSYTNQNYDAPPGGSNDVGYTLPLETTESCELLIAWGISGSFQLDTLHGSHVPSPGPNFTVRESEYGGLGLEDAITGIPGLYIGTMKWNTAAHWDLGVAAFKMKTKRCQGCARHEDEDEEMSTLTSSNTIRGMRLRRSEPAYDALQTRSESSHHKRDTPLLYDHSSEENRSAGK